MSLREDVHKIVDRLPEDRLTDVPDYLNDLQDVQMTPADTSSAIEEGLEDIRNGRTVTLAEYRWKSGV